MAAKDPGADPEAEFLKRIHEGTDYAEQLRMFTGRSPLTWSRSKDSQLRSAIADALYRHFEKCVMSHLDQMSEKGPKVRKRDFVRAYSGCLLDSLGEFGDWHTQALIARGKPVTEKARLDILLEALQRLRFLREPFFAGLWLAQALAVDWTELTDEQRNDFAGRVELHSAFWDEEVNRRIDFRCSVSGARTGPALRLNPVRMRILLLRREHPGMSHLGLCKKLDLMNERHRDSAPLPASWRKSGHKSWVHALKDPKLTRRVRTYISKATAARL